MVEKIVSGAQTRADRALLDWAESRFTVHEKKVEHHPRPRSPEKRHQIRHQKAGRPSRTSQGRSSRCAMRVNRDQAVGVTEPYHRLTEKPYHVPQWCSKHWLKAGERKGGGKRRRAS